MSCIHLHLGQAGNQIGKSFWALAEDEYFIDDNISRRRAGARATRSSTRPPHETEHPALGPGGTAMFHEDGWARCLAVDSEPKAREGGTLEGTHLARCHGVHVAHLFELLVSCHIYDSKTTTSARTASTAVAQSHRGGKENAIKEKLD